MGLFTQDAFLTKVSSIARKRIAAFASDALQAEGVAAALLKWQKKPDLKEVLAVVLEHGLTAVQEVLELIVELRGTAEEHPKLVRRINARAKRAAAFMGASATILDDLLNTVAGDLVESGVGTMALYPAADGLRSSGKATRWELESFAKASERELRRTTHFVWVDAYVESVHATRLALEANVGQDHRSRSRT